MATKVNKKSMPCNKPRRTPKHKTKSHIVKACEKGKEKIIRFGQQGKKVGTLKGTAGAPKKGESKRMTENVRVLRLDTVKILQKVGCQLHIGQIK